VSLAGAEADQARAQLAQLANDPRCDTTAGLVDIEELLTRCQMYAWDRRGKRLLHFALQRQSPAEVVLTAAAGGDGRNPIADQFLDQLEAQTALRGQLLTIETKRRGLVRLLQRRGYSIDCYTLRKVL